VAAAYRFGRDAPKEQHHPYSGLIHVPPAALVEAINTITKD
jgi:hypothetical protein